MNFKKAFLLVRIIIGLICINGYDAQAMSLNTELPLAEKTKTSDIYSFLNDPFALQWTLATENKDEQMAIETTPAEEKVLNRWKEKQSAMWNNLPNKPFIINASAYTAAADECGKSDGITSSGLKVAEKRTLACPPSYPFGTKIKIDGVGVLRCEDRGGAIKGNHFDIYVETKKDAFAFGRQHLLAEVIQ